MQHYRPQEIRNFQDTVWNHFANHRREMPWRKPSPSGYFDPYKITVSEIMLQQTQVERVKPKFNEFMAKFPTAEALATSSLSDVLVAWNGLGYNRRAKYLWLAAQCIVSEYGGVFPRDSEALQKMPGIGPNTAAAICAYAYDMPVIFLETNIRTVIIHLFFADQTNVKDTDILAIVKLTIPAKNIREWYWALMDYGSFLKSTIGNKSRQAKSYTKQSTFRGSKRQLRGMILRTLQKGPLRTEQLQSITNDDRLSATCDELARDGLVHFENDQYVLG